MAALEQLQLEQLLHEQLLELLPKQLLELLLEQLLELLLLELLKLLQLDEQLLKLLLLELLQLDEELLELLLLELLQLDEELLVSNWSCVTGSLVSSIKPYSIPLTNILSKFTAGTTILPSHGSMSMAAVTSSIGLTTPSVPPASPANSSPATLNAPNFDITIAEPESPPCVNRLEEKTRI